jgi:hypothetical protein
MNDLMISFENKVFAAGSKRLNKFKEGDYIIICAEENRKRKGFLAKILEKTAPLNDWYAKGGKLWEYNFKIEPLTDVTDISPQSDSRNQMKVIFENLGLNINNLFNSRFCSERLIEGLAIIMQNKIFTPLNKKISLDYILN